MLTRQPPPYVYADVGSTVELCCEADGHLVWSRLGTALTSPPFFQHGGCITIINLNRENAGKYICRATNQFGISEATSEVILTGDHLYSVSFFLVVIFCFVYTLSSVCKYYVIFLHMTKHNVRLTLLC